MFRLISSMDRKRGIAKQGIRPWYIPDDMREFMRLTQTYNGDVLMGSTTYQSLHLQPLPNRQNFVLTRDKTPIEGVELVHNLEKFVREWEDKDVWVVGGADVFAQIMEMGKADELYLTQIEADFHCNQFFPPYDEDFEQVEKSELHEQNGFIYTFNKYAQKQKS